MVEKTIKQGPISDLSRFVIKDTGPTNAVELKKKAGRGELKFFKIQGECKWKN